MNIGRALFSFRGRLPRIWYWSLTVALVAGLGVFLYLAFDSDVFWSETGFAWALAVMVLGTYVLFALAAKRLHDRDRPSWPLLLAFVPIAGWIFPFWFIVQAVLPGTRGDNRFGADPRAGTRAMAMPFVRRLILSDRGDTGSSFALVILVLAGVAGFFIAKDWAAGHHVAISSPGQYVDAAFRAVTDRQYWAALKQRMDKGSQAAGASLATANGGRGDRAGAATNAAVAAASTAPHADPPAVVPAADANDDGTWNVGYETDPDSPISDRKVLVAQMTHHNTAASGHIDVQATCANGVVDFEFDSFGLLGKGANFDYAMGQSDGSVFIVYRIDSGPQLLASNLLSSNHNYTNVVNVPFAEVGSDYKPVSLDEIQAQAETAAKDSDTLGKSLLNAMTLSMSGIGALYGAMTPRDIEPFLRAHLVRFQIGLQGGAKEIIALSPQDSALRGFFSKCGFAGAATSE